MSGTAVRRLNVIALAEKVQKEGRESVLAGTFDRFLEALAKSQARFAFDNLYDRDLWDRMEVEAFARLLIAYEVDAYGTFYDHLVIGRDYFERMFSKEYFWIAEGYGD